MVQIIINIIFFLCLIFLIYINSRLYVYINSLEEKIKICIDKNDNMYYSLKELIQEDFLLKDGIEGQSIGKRLCGIAVVHVADNTPCSWSASVVRNLIGFFGVLDLVYLFGSDRRRLGDLAAGTQVIKSTYLA